MGDVSGRDIGGEGSEGRVTTLVEEGSPTIEHFLSSIYHFTSFIYHQSKLKFFLLCFKPGVEGAS